MNWKGPAFALTALLLIIVTISIFSMLGEEPKATVEKKPFSFNMSVLGHTLIDNDMGQLYRSAITVNILSTSVDNATVELVTLPKKPLQEIYSVTEFPVDKDKDELIKELEKSLSSYGIDVEGITLGEAMEIKDAVIILPSKAIPSALASGKLNSLISGNTVIYFGKPLDISVDEYDTQNQTGNAVYSLLNVSYDGQSISRKQDGPNITKSGNASILEYDDGWFVIFSDSKDSSIGDEIASMILHQAWQNQRGSTVISPSLQDGSMKMTFYSGSGEFDGYYTRLVYLVSSGNISKSEIKDLGQLKAGESILKIPQTWVTNKSIDYSFELHGNQEYPVHYDMQMVFLHDGKVVDNLTAKQVTMRTIALESGSIQSGLGPGSYTVKLVDQFGNTHSSAYMHIPELKVKLIRIEDDVHVFRISLDGSPAASVNGTLIANNKSKFNIKTDLNGEAKLDFMLAEGLHSFTVEINNETATTYYRKTDDMSTIMFYAIFVLGGGFLAVFIALNSKVERKYRISTQPRMRIKSKALKIPYFVFLDIFKMVQDDRAPGLPLSVTDIRIGMRKHAAFKGSPLFVTDSNLYTILDSIAKKGSFLSYIGYYLPKEMSFGKPIEYWVIRRKLHDRFIEAGNELPFSKEADFVLDKKLIHIWKDFDSAKLVSLCRKNDNLLIFPDEEKKENFLKNAMKMDASWIRLSLETQYGRIDCQTLNEFLGWRFNGKS